MGMFGNTFAPGGTGRSIAGYVGDALLSMSGRSPIYTPLMVEQRQQQNMLARQASQQNLEYQRQLALRQNEVQNPLPTELQRNYQYLKGVNPTLAESYLKNQSDPVTLGVDPATGQPTFVHKSGAPIVPANNSNVISKKMPNGDTAYWVNGAWYDNPEGK